MIAAVRSQVSVNEPVLYVAFELAKKQWKLALTSGFGVAPVVRSVPAGDWRAIEQALSLARRRFSVPETTRVISCYEAGRDGFWIDRALQERGIANRVVDSSSIDVKRRRRRMKTDRLDALKLVHMLVRAEGLADTMSRYLIRRIEDNPAIVLRTRTQVVALEGNGHLERVTWRDDRTGALETPSIRHVFMMTGAVPNTGWLERCIALDDKGFIKTGPELSPDDLSAARWPLSRPPYLLETSRPGVFAVGDVRGGNVKRVASAVGEGSIAVAFVHQVLHQ